MKGGIRLTISQVSLILIGLVCVTVLVFAWTKTTFMTSFVPSQSSILQLDLGPIETLGGNDNLVQAWTVQIDSLSSSGISKRENIENSTTNVEGETPATLVIKTGSEEVSERINKSKQAKIVPENTPTLESSVKSEQIGNSSSSTGRKKRTGSEDVSQKKNKSKRADIMPASSLPKESSIKAEQPRNMSAITEKKECNYAKGKWVFDYNRPLYSGSGCKQWLSSMWACRLTQRTDFEYEKLHWQPKGCKRDDFTGSKFLERMQDKTLAFVGDSLGRQQFQSLMCMVTGDEERPDVLDVGYEYSLVQTRGAVRPDGWAYRFPSTNTTILYYWSASLCGLEPINLSTNIAMHLDRPPSFLRRFLPKFHILVLNTGHHWNRGKLNANRWVMYINGIQNRKALDIAGAKNFTVHSIVKWVNLQLPLYPGSKVFLRSILPRHFFNGDWNTGGTCDNTTPRGKEVVEDESRDPLAAAAVRGTNVKYLDITGLSELRDEGHISRYSIKAMPGMQDCLHWCLPGVPDTWNEILLAQI